MTEIQDNTGAPWLALSSAIGLITAQRAGVGHTGLPDGQEPGDVITALTAITDALLTSLVPSGQVDALLHELGLAALTASSQP